ncbi:MAG: inosine/xanthosine triphosphatase [Thermoplasmata archaeon]|nr:inosine/xanthosine triphosphatase [Thermoplasmata archaeon]
MAPLKVCLGGTFDKIHKGHKALLAKAFEIGDEVVIGLTSDEMARSEKSYSASPYDARKAGLNNYLAASGHSSFEIVSIDDRFGPAKSEPIDAIVVSMETKRTAEELNAERMKSGLSPLRIVEIGMVLAEDCAPVSSSRIRLEEIDESGKMVRPLVVNVGSKNRTKIWAVRDVFLRLYSKVEVHGVPVPSDVPKQPVDEEAVQGATNRAHASLGDADFGIGIESGVVWDEQSKSHLCVQFCAVVDKLEKVTTGHSAGFMLPADVAERIRAGSDLAEALSDVEGARMEESKGAVGFLSGNLISRSNLCESAVLMAMIPRIRRDLYFPI